jgi:protein arginine kinase activator
MKCENCNTREANVHVTKIMNGVKSEMHLCEECAKQKQDMGVSSLNIGFPMSFQNIVDGLFEVMGSPVQTQQNNNIAKCSICGMTFEEFRKNGKVGCSNCYSTFEYDMFPLIKRVHGNIQHTGKVPKRTGNKIKAVREINKLKDELKRHVENEEYEKAALIRDEIRNLENDMNKVEE